MHLSGKTDALKSKNDQIIRQKPQMRNLLVFKPLLCGIQCRKVLSSSWENICSIFHLRSDFIRLTTISNAHVTSVQKPYFNVCKQQCYLNYLASMVAKYHVVRHAVIFWVLTNLISAVSDMWFCILDVKLTDNLFILILAVFLGRFMLVVCNEAPVAESEF